MASERHQVLQSLATKYGLDISKIVLRGWKAEDPQVQEILDQAAAAQTQRDVERAEHGLALEKLKNEREQLEKAALNYALKASAAEAEGNQDGARIAAMYKAIKDRIDVNGTGNSTTAQLVRAHVVGQAAGESGGKVVFKQSDHE